MRGKRVLGRGAQLTLVLFLMVTMLGCSVIGQAEPTVVATAPAGVATSVATTTASTPAATPALLGATPGITGTVVSATPARTPTVAATPAAGAGASDGNSGMLTVAVREVVKKVRPAVVQIDDNS